jgi:hypothetical protein
MNLKSLLPAVAIFATACAEEPMKLLPEAAPPAVADRQDTQGADRVRLDGWVGSRIAASEAARLVRIDPERLLEGFLKRPGRQAWDGEHAGKWIHAATLAWANTGDPELRKLLDKVVSMLSACQLDDGYLGTYVPAEYWTEWDVWVHKYNLLGLIAYARYTGDAAALQVCRRMGDLLCREFGEAPGQRDIMKAGHFNGMAPMGVIEPMALLYRLTGEPRYLEFCRYIVRASEGPTGPGLLATMAATGRVTDARSTKAYEMLTCFNGMLEMHRTSGDARLLDASLRLWDDVVARRLYPTGAASYRELFRADGDFPDCDDIGETCVAVTWMQVNLQLLRLTGEARFADEIERVLLNHLLAAQRPDGSAWCYFTPPQFLKAHTAAPEVSCCYSSGPRSLALVPTFAVTTDAAGIVVNLYDTGAARVALRDGTGVTVAVETEYPASGLVRLTLDPETAKTFALALRVPAWAGSAMATVDGAPVDAPRGPGGYCIIERAWTKGAVVELRLPIGPRVLTSTKDGVERAALMYGPLVLAADEALLPDGANAWQVCLPSADLAGLGFSVDPAPEPFRRWKGARTFGVDAGIRRTAGSETAIVASRIQLVPFAEAAGYGGSYRVWFPVKRDFDTRNLLAEGTIAATSPTEDLRKAMDGEITTTAVMRAAPAPGEQGFDVVLPRPVTLRRLAFSHGVAWGAAGWFDASAGAPRFEYRRTPDGPWELAGPLAGYPATTAADGGPIQREMAKTIFLTTAEFERANRAHTYSVVLPEAVTVVAVRVRGQPSMPEPGKGELKCAEIQAFAE